MFDIDEIRKQALASMRETMEKNEERISKIEVPSSEKGASVSAAEVEEQIHLEPMSVAEASGLGDDELDQAVEPFRAGVVVEVATVGHDAVQMGPDHARHAAHGIEAAPQRPGDPLRQE